MTEYVQSINNFYHGTYLDDSRNLTQAISDSNDVIASYKQKVSFLRKESYWIGAKPRNDIVDNLYALAKEGKISPDRWNMYGDAAKSWEKQAPQIKKLYSDSEKEKSLPQKEISKEKSLVEKTLKSAEDDEKVKVLTDKGYWIGRNPKSDLVENLYILVSAGLITPSKWNKLGETSKSWESQSDEIKNLTKKLEEIKKESLPREEKQSETINVPAKNLDEKPEETIEPEKNQNADQKNEISASLTKEEAKMFLEIAKSAGYDHVHTVRSGENISKIAALYDTTIQRLLWDNKDVIYGLGNHLIIGQELKIKTDELSKQEQKQIQDYYNNLVALERHKECLKQSPEFTSKLKNDILQYYQKKGAFDEIEEKTINQFIAKNLSELFENSSFFEIRDNLAGPTYPHKVNELLKTLPDYKSSQFLEMHLDVPGSQELRIFFRGDDGKAKVWTKANGIQDAEHNYWFVKLGKNYIVEFGAIDLFAKSLIETDKDESAKFDAYIQNQISELKDGMEALGITKPVFLAGHGGTADNSFLKIYSQEQQKFLSNTGASFYYTKEQKQIAEVISRSLLSSNV